MTSSPILPEPSTIPAAIRKELHLKEEAALTLVKVGDVILMTQKPLEVDSVAKKARKEMKHSGLTVEDILADLAGCGKTRVA